MLMLKDQKDTEDWSNGAENSALKQKNIWLYKYNKLIIHNITLLQYFAQLNTVLVEHKRHLSESLNIIPNFWP